MSKFKGFFGGSRAAVGTAPTPPPRYNELVDWMQGRIDEDRASGHSLLSEIALLRNVIDDALLVCATHPYSGADTAAEVAAKLHRATAARVGFSLPKPPGPEVDAAVREYAYQKALGHKQQKLNRAKTYAQRLEHALAKQKGQTASDQHYIDLLEEAVDDETLAEIRAVAATYRAQAGSAEGNTERPNTQPLAAPKSSPSPAPVSSEETP